MAMNVNGGIERPSPMGNGFKISASLLQDAAKDFGPRYDKDKCVFVNGKNSCEQDAALGFRR